MNENLKQFLGKGVKYFPDGTQIFAEQGKGLQLVLDVRGYGAIQHLFNNLEDADKFQDEMAQFFVDAINEKLNNKKCSTHCDYPNCTLPECRQKEIDAEQGKKSKPLDFYEYVKEFHSAKDGGYDQLSDFSKQERLGLVQEYNGYLRGFNHNK